ncbi:MAG: glutamine--fructose-6-phosphate transaminase (isomerizing) [Candidatus Omnitrophica bacterium]|nr:glutamine--fructose-6-phosphate transaminase (isomerizing) [Candidatus Omnitrophota bacterium]MCM8830948.1 glutamine--fructose-6-phosphate transaminase (isomerizing) [Candidatus Omnitrophota bacterium]
MCGIFGYIGEERPLQLWLDGISRLEYRGYDSCGIATIKEDFVFLKKQQGKILNLRLHLKDLSSKKFNVGIAHTRWATHGKPSNLNAHPHTDCNKKIAIVHNGIIENYLQIKEKLIAEGHKFLSQTDTEVIAHLIEKFYQEDILSAVLKCVKELEGSFALAIISTHQPQKLIGVRKGSPLILGLTGKGQFLASDIPAILPLTKKVVYLEDEQIAVLEKDKISIFDFKGKPNKVNIEKVNIKEEQALKKGFSHFMLKEIFEQPEVLDKTFLLYLKKDKIYFPQINLSEKFLKNLKNIFITACGTAYHAGYVGKYFLEKYCDVNVCIDVASEFRYRNINLSKKSLLISISQSGETADTLFAVKHAKSKKIKVLSICNVLGSSLAKLSDNLILTPAGPEIGVASTKAYTAQILVLILFSLYLAKIKNRISIEFYYEAIRELKVIPNLISEILGQSERIKRIADKFSKFGCFLFLGRGINYPSALEGALKLKEISYIPAEGYAAGEMKHGPIALIDEYRAVVCIAVSDNLYEKMVSNIQEIKARNGKVLAILNYQDTQVSRLSDETIYISKLKNQDFSPLLVAVVLQLFAYYIAKNLGREIDQPRNLAKSVTVE